MIVSEELWKGRFAGDDDIIGQSVVLNGYPFTIICPSTILASFCCPLRPSMVKELRDKTGAGMMDCKAALIESDGDMEAAIDWLRTKGLAKAAKKAS